MRPLPPTPPPETPARAAPPRVGIAGGALLGLLLAVPLILVLARRPLSRAAPTPPPAGAVPGPGVPTGASGLPADLAELYQHTMQVLSLAAGGSDDEPVILKLHEVETALASSRAAFDALPATAREPVRRTARELQADWNVAAGRVLKSPGFSRELRALTREISLELHVLADGGYRVEEALEAAGERALAALDAIRRDTPRSGEAPVILERCARRLGGLQPAHDSLAGPDRERCIEVARRLIREFSALATAAALSPRWSPGLRDTVTELLEQLSSFAQ